MMPCLPMLLQRWLRQITNIGLGVKNAPNGTWRCVWRTIKTRCLEFILVFLFNPCRGNSQLLAGAWIAHVWFYDHHESIERYLAPDQVPILPLRKEHIIFIPPHLLRYPRIHRAPPSTVRKSFIRSSERFGCNRNTSVAVCAQCARWKVFYLSKPDAHHARC